MGFAFSVTANVDGRTASLVGMEFTYCSTNPTTFIGVGTLPWPVFTEEGDVSTNAGSTGAGVEARATATFQTWEGTHGSAVGGSVRNKTDYLTATAAAKAGAMTGLEATALAVAAEDQHSKVTLGLDGTTQAGYDKNTKSVGASFLGFGISFGGPDWH
jgi:hypothetical protein